MNAGVELDQIAEVVGRVEVETETGQFDDGRLDPELARFGHMRGKAAEAEPEAKSERSSRPTPQEQAVRAGPVLVRARSRPDRASLTERAHVSHSPAAGRRRGSASASKRLTAPTRRACSRRREQVPESARSDGCR